RRCAIVRAFLEIRSSGGGGCAAGGVGTMRVAADVALAVVALLHVLFLVLEMFLWTKPTGRRVFGLSRELAEETRALAANQGLYNGFLAAGLVWGLWAGPVAGFAPRVFFTA